MSHVDAIRAKHQSIVAKYGPKLASLTAKSVEVLEISAGAAIGGVIQGREIAKGNVAGAKLFGLPADLAIGLVFEAAGHFDLAGPEWSHHLNNIGAGFIAGYASDWGNALGKRWIEEGHIPLLDPLLGRAQPQGGLPGTVAKGEVSANQMAEILRERVQGPAGQ